MAITLTIPELRQMGVMKQGDQLVRIKQAATAPAMAGQQLHPASAYRSKAEAAYAGRLYVLQRAGDLRDWRYECITLRLGDRVRYTPDFRLVMRDGSVELHEVKGPYQYEDARIKLQVAASMYPEFKFVLVRMRGGSVETMTTIRPIAGNSSNPET